MKCKECRGFGVIDCPVCKGSGWDPRFDEKVPCTYCEGKGYCTCNICGGSGTED